MSQGKRIYWCSFMGLISVSYLYCTWGWVSSDSAGVISTLEYWLPCTGRTLLALNGLTLSAFLTWKSHPYHHVTDCGLRSSESWGRFTCSQHSARGMPLWAFALLNGAVFLAVPWALRAATKSSHHFGRDQTLASGDESWQERQPGAQRRCRWWSSLHPDHPRLPLADLMGSGVYFPIPPSTPPVHSLLIFLWLGWEWFEPQVQGWIMNGLSLSSWLWLASEWAVDQVSPSIVRGGLFRRFLETFFRKWLPKSLPLVLGCGCAVWKGCSSLVTMRGKPQAKAIGHWNGATVETARVPDVPRAAELLNPNVGSDLTFPVL